MKRLLPLLIMFVFQQNLFCQFNLSTSTIVYSYSQIWATHELIIKDSEYYKRLDQINQQIYEKEIEYLRQAFSMMDSCDWERAIYFSRQISNNHELICEKKFIQAISNLKLKKKSEAKQCYRYCKDYCDPEKTRLIENNFKEAGVSTNKGCLWFLF